MKQEVPVASIEFDDNAVADFFDAQVDAGRKPEQFAKWLRRLPVEADVQVNLLAMEISSTEPRWPDAAGHP